LQISQSSLKKCTRQFYYSKILNLGGDQTGSLTALGSVWHFSVDVYEQYDHDIDLARRTFIRYWENPDALGVHIDFWHKGTTKEGLRKRGLQMLDRYHELAPWRQGRMIGTEIKFVVPIGDQELKGFIDKLWYRPGQKRIEVIDFKTGSFVPRKLRHNIQFTAYCYATERPEFWENVPGFEDGYERFKGWKRAGWWYHARNNKMFNAGGRGTEDYRRLSLAVGQLVEAVEKDVYPLDVSGENCGWCPYAESVCGSEVSDPLEGL